MFSNKNLISAKGDTFLQAYSILCANDQPVHKMRKLFDMGGILLDVSKFYNPFKLEKYRINNNSAFANCAAMFNHEADIVDYGLYKTCEQMCNRISIKASTGFKKTLNDLDEISPADDVQKEIFVGRIHYENVLLLENIFQKKSANCDHLYQHEYNKVVRVTIIYTLGFFVLVLITFFIIYLV